MSSTSSIENVTSHLDWLEEALITIKENLAIYPASEYSKVAELVKKYLERNQKKPEDLFNCLNDKSLKCSKDYILLGFSFEHGIGTIPNLTKAFLEFQKAANAKDSFGQFFLGHCYDNGIGTAQDQRKAFELYSKAAETGDITAQYNLAICYQDGEGTMKNLEKAFKLYSNAAEAGHLDAQYSLAICYQDGEGTTKNEKKAFQLYSKAAEAGHLDAQYNLALCYDNGLGTKKNLEKAFKLYSKAAEAGYINAQTNLAVSYQNGWGTKKNLEKAFELYAKAAEAGNLEAQCNLAICYDNGWGTIKNEEKAFELYSKAAEAGYLDAQYNLALCYQKGEGTTKNSEKAFELYSKAAEVGHLDAQYALAFCYENGEGTMKNLEKAFELYSKSAEEGDLVAKHQLELHFYNVLGTTRNLEKVENPSPQNNLGTSHRNAWRTVKNLEKTFELYSKTVEQGNTSALYNLGWCYQNGWGTTKNLEKAFELYFKAAEINNLSHRSDFPDLSVLDELTFEDQDDLERFILQFQARGLKCKNNSKREFLDFETFFDQLSDEFKCLKCGNLSVIISRCPDERDTDEKDTDERDTDERDTDEMDTDEMDIDESGDIFETGLPGCPFCDYDDIFTRLPKCSECDDTLKDPLWCNSCESSRFSKIWGTCDIGNDNIDNYIEYTQSNSENSRECLEWISPDEIEFLDKVGEGGFGVVKEGRWERGKILFWDEKNQKHERSGVTKVALKYLKDSQNIKYINSDEFTAHFNCATCKYILEFYGITKDIITDEFIMILPFAEHGDLRAFLKMNEITLTWEMVLCILFQIACGLRYIHESGLVHGDLHPGNILVLKSNPLKVAIADLGLCRPANYSPQPGKIFGVVRYLAPEICNLSPHTKHTKYSDIYSCAIISWEIIAGERPWNHIVDPMSIQLYTIQGKRLPIQKHTPQCIQEMIEKNWDDKPHCRDSAEELQKRIIAARDNCNLNETIGRKRLNYKTIQGDNHDKSQKILSPTISQNELDLAFS